MNEVLTYAVDVADLGVVFGYWLLCYAIGFGAGYQLQVIRRMLDYGA